ncbi:holin, partial [Salmonella enterica subsp. enterica serovar Carmel]|nr:holin [Salmonella enterica subsp. enterica serovar Carmel]
MFSRAGDGPFLFTGEKRMSEPLSGTGTAVALGGATVF